MEQKEKIKAGCNGIPAKNLANYVRDGVVSLDELPLTPEKRSTVEQLLSESEETLWEEIKMKNTVEGYQKYLSCYPKGKHSDEARTVLATLEDKFWEAIRGNLTKEGLESYVKSFPEGKHAEECKKLLEDLPYLEVKKKDTIQAYREFMEKYPGKHTEDILNRIEEIEDESDWKTACYNNTKDAYNIYLEKHPNGKHKDEAVSKIQYRSGKDIFLEKLKADPNSMSAWEIQKEVENGTVSWGDLETVFDKMKIEAIKGWKKAGELPIIEDPRIPQGFTEVYFWGTKGTGKTCVIGSVLGSLNNIKKNYIPIQSDSEVYRLRLTNLFNGKNSICTLPDSTFTTNLPAMPFKIKDEKRGRHKLMFIDMAGEAFTGIFKSRNNLNMTDEEKTAVQRIENYLTGKQRNPTIHFFVVEYGSALNEVMPGITQINVLQNVAAYFQEKGIFQKSTVGVYVIVTKCDRIPCSRAERAKRANEYLSNGMMGNFIDNLKDEYTQKARVADFMKISFSIGDVFAKNFCVFDDQDTDKIIEKLLLKTPVDSGLLGWLRYH